MKLNKNKKIISLLFAAMMIISTFATFITPVAASELSAPTDIRITDPSIVNITETHRFTVPPAPTDAALGADIAATSVAAGRYHSLAIRRDGTLSAWGSNWFGQPVYDLSENDRTIHPKE
jgi:zona occludens toxin (predicted ATPase)